MNVNYRFKWLGVMGLGWCLAIWVIFKHDYGAGMFFTGGVYTYILVAALVANTQSIEERKSR